MKKEVRSDGLVRGAMRCAAWGGFLLLGLGGVLAAGPVEVFSTGFEPPVYEEGFTVAGQENWVSDADGGNQVFSGHFPELGQHALIGFSKPEGDVSSVSLWRPLNYNGVTAGNPVVTFSVVLSFVDSTDPARRDSFRWSVYNTNAEPTRLFSLDFDNATTNIAYLLDDDEGFIATPYYFERDGLYDLTITMDFGLNRWGVRLNDEEILAELPMTTTGAGLHLGDIDAVWVRGAAPEFGDNYMVFDDYRVTAAPELAPRLALVERQSDGSALVEVVGSPGQSFELESSENLNMWSALVSETLPDSGRFTYVDAAAVGKDQRYYRSRVTP